MPNFRDAARVYVNNLPWETKEEDLAAALGVAGSIVKTEVYRYRDGRSKVRRARRFVVPQGK